MEFDYLRLIWLDRAERYNILKEVTTSSSQVFVTYFVWESDYLRASDKR